MMKRKYIKTIGAALLALVLGGCTHTTVLEREETPQTPIEIHTAPLLQAGLESTRGVVDGWSANEVYMACYREDILKPDFAGEFDRVLKGFVTNNKTTFQPLLTYPLTTTKNIYLRGFHPREGIVNLDADLAISGNKIEYLITGQEDIMISNMVSGSLDNTMAAQYAATTGGLLEYRHLLSQIVFSMKADASFPKTMKVTEIKIKEISRTAILDLDPTLDWDDTGVITFTKDPINSEITAYSSASGYVLTTTESTLTGAIMIQAGEPFDIEVAFSTGERVAVTSVKNIDDVDITQGNTRRGYKYEIKLSFASSAFTPSVTAAWNLINTGIGPIDTTDPDEEKWW